MLKLDTSESFFSGSIPDCCSIDGLDSPQVNENGPISLLAYGILYLSFSRSPLRVRLLLEHLLLHIAILFRIRTQLVPALRGCSLECHCSQEWYSPSATLAIRLLRARLIKHWVARGWRRLGLCRGIGTRVRNGTLGCFSARSCSGLFLPRLRSFPREVHFVQGCFKSHLTSTGFNLQAALDVLGANACPPADPTLPAFAHFVLINSTLSSICKYFPRRRWVTCLDCAVSGGPMYNTQLISGPTSAPFIS
jgi:hypothetical protein